MNLKGRSLLFHKLPKPGKIAIVPTKNCLTRDDLSLAYTPGVAYACLEIEKYEDEIYEYTGKGNLVAVISDGSAVLGLGDIGAAASKPVMEGKALLFKRFADVNAFDIEIKERDPDRFVEIVKSLGTTFGGINLEDIASPRCFYIEERLKSEMDIVVFHDDQHGTAVVVGAALINGLEINGKSKENLTVAISGAGAAAVAIARHLMRLGIPEESIFAADRKGVLYEGREDQKTPYHRFLFRNTRHRTLADIMKGADVFIGVSAKGLVSSDMVRSMAKDPIVFALANPDPEIPYEVVRETRPDAIVGTGRSDYPNQVNNALGFPAIFRGALDIRAKAITEEMKLAASHAVAEVARMGSSQDVLDACGLKKLQFSQEYVIPNPFDKRVLLEEASAVAGAGMNDNVHRIVVDISEYREKLIEQFNIAME